MNCPAECCKRQVLLAGSATLNYASASLAAAWHRHFELCFLFIGGDGVVQAHCPLVSATSLFMLHLFFGKFVAAL